MPIASAHAKATVPIQNIATGIGGSSAGLNTRSVPIWASKYSLKHSTPITASTTPKNPLQNAGTSNRPAIAYAHAAPRRYGSNPA